ncbi:MAG: amidase [Gammaproteobacteria bacterium]|nr:amidase [Gammaproteobacteria bacterium]
MSIFPDYEKYDAVGLAELVKSRRITAAELLEAAVERCESRNPSINAVVCAFHHRVSLTPAQDSGSSLLGGVPFLLKDAGAHCAGEPTGYACRLFDGFVAERDTTLVRRYREAGLVIFGKTNTPELALAVTTEPKETGPTLNPWNQDYSPGGSSGGAAAAVAAGIVPAAHGSDGGGSIRIPASACGLVGLKPTRGRAPAGPDRAEGWAGMAQHHVITRSVRDCAAFLDAVEGPEPGDPYHPPAHHGSWMDALQAPLGALRVALIEDAFNGVAVDPDVIDVVREAARLCETLGHRVEEARCPLSPEQLHNCATLILGAHVNADIQARCRLLGREFRREDVSHVTWRMAQAGIEASASDYAAALSHIHYIGRRMGEFSNQYDVILSPTTAAPPPRLGVIDMDTENLKGYMQATSRYTAFTQLFNVTGQPALSLPLGFSSQGLPVGVQLAAAQGGEAVLLRLAAQLERAQPWPGLAPMAGGPA